MWNIFDSLRNLVSGLGTHKDPTTMSRYHYHELNRHELEQAYRSNWVARRVIDAPAEDAAREWRDWQCEQEDIAKIENLERRFQLQKKFKDVIIRSRLYGGAALVMGVEGGGEVWEEIDVDSLGADCLKFIVVLNRYELSAGPRIYDAESPFYTRPEYYTISTPMVGFDVNNTGSDDPNKKRLDTGIVRIHPSRVIEFSGNPLPDWRLTTLGAGWGDSVLQTLDEHLKDFGLTVGSIANMINDSKIDVIKMPKLSKLLSTKDSTNALYNRFAAANVGKSTLNALLLDSEEEWNRVQTTFSGLAEIMHQYMELVSGGAGIPMSRLMGSSPGKGLNTAGGGESDLRNYYDDIMSKQRVDYGPIMAPLDNVLQISALGHLDETIYYDWAPLYKPEPKDVATVNLQKAQAFQIDANLGLINPDALREARINQLIEDMVYPGLDDAIEEFGSEPDEPEVGPEDVQQHMNMLTKSSKELQSYGQMAQKALPAPAPDTTK